MPDLEIKKKEETPDLKLKEPQEINVHRRDTSMRSMTMISVKKVEVAPQVPSDDEI